LLERLPGFSPVPRSELLRQSLDYTHRNQTLFGTFNLNCQRTGSSSKFIIHAAILDVKCPVEPLNPASRLHARIASNATPSSTESGMMRTAALPRRSGAGTDALLNGPNGGFRGVIAPHRGGPVFAASALVPASLKGLIACAFGNC